jgi:TatD DNase family protein
VKELIGSAQQRQGSDEIMWFDIGVNLNSSQFRHDVDAVVARARAAGVMQQLLISSDLEETEHVVALAEQWGLHASAGVHPHQASSWNEHSSAQLVQLAQSPHVVVIGECGLDFNRNYSPPDAQRDAFAAQLQIAAQLHKPVYMHCRDAHDDFFSILDRYRAQLPNAILHCFTGTRAQLQDCLKRDLYIGITGWICDERRGHDLREAVRDIPLDRLLLETDAPYLLPRDLPEKPSSRRNEPAYLPHIAQAVAALKGVALNELAQQCWRNSVTAFGIET